MSIYSIRYWVYRNPVDTPLDPGSFDFPLFNPWYRMSFKVMEVGCMDRLVRTLIFSRLPNFRVYYVGSDLQCPVIRDFPPLLTANQTGFVSDVVQRQNLPIPVVVEQVTVSYTEPYSERFFRLH